MDESFEWDENKNAINKDKDGVDFIQAQQAFLDSKRIIIYDEKHSVDENRYYCIGQVGKRIMTVRFTVRNDKFRIIGAGYWRQGKKRYEKENSIHR